VLRDVPAPATTGHGETGERAALAEPGASKQGESAGFPHVAIGSDLDC